MSLSSIQLEAFSAVTQTLNFTKAAGVLHITQSALSQRILNLESELGTTLFIRDKSGIKLTEEAQELIKYCQFKNQCEDEFVSRLKSKDAKQIAGTLRVGGFSSVMRSIFLPAVSDLLSKNPLLKLQMLIREVYELFDLLKRSEIDFIIINSNIEREDIESVFLGYEENVLVQKKNYSGEKIYLDHDENDEVTFTYLKKFARKSKKIKRCYLDDTYGILEAVKLGLGYAVLPKHLIENEKNIEVINPQQILKIPVYLCFYRQPYYTKMHLSLVEKVVSAFKEILPTF